MISTIKVGSVYSEKPGSVWSGQVGSITTEEVGSTLSEFPLDRIVSFEPITLKYIKNKSIDFEEYFEDIIGVTRPEGGRLTKIELLFTNEEAPYVLTKPIHGSQKKKKHDEDGLVVTIEIIPNLEFEKLILSFGERVKIIGPKKIADAIKGRFSDALKQY